MYFKNIIAIVGHACAGKTTIGKKMGTRLLTPCVDVDERLEHRFHSPIGDLPKQLGEEAFIEAEYNEILASTKLLQQISGILVIGASGIYSAAARHHIKNYLFTIELRISHQTFNSRRSERHSEFQFVGLDDSTPSSQTRWFTKRSQHYASIRDVVVDTDKGGTADELSQHIVEKLQVHEKYFDYSLPTSLMPT